MKKMEVLLKNYLSHFLWFSIVFTVITIIISALKLDFLMTIFLLHLFVIVYFAFVYFVVKKNEIVGEDIFHFYANATIILSVILCIYLLISQLGISNVILKIILAIICTPFIPVFIIFSIAISNNVIDVIIMIVHALYFNLLFCYWGVKPNIEKKKRLIYLLSLFAIVSIDWIIYILYICR